MLKDTPDWKEYCIICEERGTKPSLRGFNRWQTSSSNIVTYFHDIDPDGTLKKQVIENREFLNDVCR